MTGTTISVMGVDIGQKRDPTAICVAQMESRQGPHKQEWHYLVRHLERFPLRTPYPEGVQRIEDVASGVCKKAGYSPELYVDVTGVGTPIIDLLRKGAPAVPSVIAVYFNHGDRRKEDEAGGYKQVSLGKAWVVSRQQTLLQTARIHLPETAEARTLAQELIDFEIRVDENANDKYGAFHVGTHDDLVTTLGLVVQTQKGHLPAPLPRIAAPPTSYAQAMKRRRDLRSANW